MRRGITLKRSYKKYLKEADCLKELELIRWGISPICPYCKQRKFSRVGNTTRYHCNICNTSFSVTVNTLFHRTHLDLRKWFAAIVLVLDGKGQMSVRELANEINVNKNTAARIVLKIKNAIAQNPHMIIWIVQNFQRHQLPRFR